MRRRQFLQTAGGIALSSTLPYHLIRTAHAGSSPAEFTSVEQPIVVNICLDGGPDFRHIIAPPYSSDENSFGFQYWENRAFSHAIAQSPIAYENRWQEDFEDRGEFGLLNNCGWLRDMWDGGNVAMVNNAVGSRARDHSLGLLVLEHGDLTSGPHDVSKPGWGGRLAAAIGGEATILSLTRQPRRFCYGPHPTNPLDHRNDRLVAVRDSRDVQLFTPDEDMSLQDDAAVMARSLGSYYAAKRDVMPAESPFARFVEHERKYRGFGDAMTARLETIPVPPEIEALYEGDATLNSRYLGRQIRNLYDCLACHDIIKFRVASMEYGGFDSHDNQKRFLERRMNDLFGTDRAFDTLFKCLPPAVADNLIVVFSGEFGRQLRANGDNGTDHGRGNTILVVGNPVNGGQYGELFPQDEVERVSRRSPDITGKTSIEHAFGAVCDLAEAETGNTVFPNRPEAILEEGVDAQLFNA